MCRSQTHRVLIGVVADGQGFAGALWNLGCEPGSKKPLRDAGAPTYLRRPVAATWLVSDNDVTDLPGFGALDSRAALPAFHPTWDLPLHLLDPPAAAIDA